MLPRGLVRRRVTLRAAGSAATLHPFHERELRLEQRQPASPPRLQHPLRLLREPLLRRGCRLGPRRTRRTSRRHTRRSERGSPLGVHQPFRHQSVLALAAVQRGRRRSPLVSPVHCPQQPRPSGSITGTVPGDVRARRHALVPERPGERGGIPRGRRSLSARRCAGTVGARRGQSFGQLIVVATRSLLNDRFGVHVLHIPAATEA